MTLTTVTRPDCLLAEKNTVEEKCLIKGSAVGANCQIKTGAKLTREGGQSGMAGQSLRRADKRKVVGTGTVNLQDVESDSSIRRTILI